MDYVGKYVILDIKGYCREDFELLIIYSILCNCLFFYYYFYRVGGYFNKFVFDYFKI